METVGTRVNRGDAAFIANDAAQRELVAELREKLAVAAKGGSEASRTRHVERGKLLARDRIDALLDSASPFLEIAPLAANGLYGDEAPGAGVVCGWTKASSKYFWARLIRRFTVASEQPHMRATVSRS